MAAAVAMVVEARVSGVAVMVEVARVKARVVKALATAEVKARRGGGDAGGGCGARRNRGGERRALRRAPEGVISEKKKGCTPISMSRVLAMSRVSFST